MKTQIIQDHNGIPTGVFIPIKDWNLLKTKYPELNSSTDSFYLSETQKKILDSQNDLKVSDYQNHEEFMIELRKKYEL